jgi:hypothetical protein
MAAGGMGSAARLIPRTPASKQALVMAKSGSQHLRWFVLLNEIIMLLIGTSNPAVRLTPISCT